MSTQECQFALQLTHEAATSLPPGIFNICFLLFSFCFCSFVFIFPRFSPEIFNICLSPPFNFCSFPVFLFLFFSFNFSDSLVYSWSLVILSFDNCLHKQTSFLDLHCFSTTKQWWAKGPLLFNSWWRSLLKLPSIHLWT